MNKWGLVFIESPRAADRGGAKKFIWGWIIFLDVVERRGHIERQLQKWGHFDFATGTVGKSDSTGSWMTWGFEMACILVVVATYLVPATLQSLFGKLGGMGLITFLCSDGQLAVKGWVGWTRVLSESGVGRGSVLSHMSIWWPFWMSIP